MSEERKLPARVKQAEIAKVHVAYAHKPQTLAKHSELMRSVLADYAKDFKSFASAQTKTEALTKFKELSGLNSDAAALYVYNLAMLDVRGLLPITEMLQDSIVRTYRDQERLETMMQDLESDMEQFRTGKFKDSSNELNEKYGSPFEAKSTLRKQFLDAADIKLKAQQSIADVSIKLSKNVIDKEKVEVQIDRNKMLNRHLDVIEKGTIEDKLAKIDALTGSIDVDGVVVFEDAEEHDDREDLINGD